jgi:hypothetical protein
MSLDSLSQVCGPVRDCLFPSGWKELAALSQIRRGAISSQPREAVAGGWVAQILVLNICDQ